MAYAVGNIILIILISFNLVFGTNSFQFILRHLELFSREIVQKAREPALRGGELHLLVHRLMVHL